MTQSRGVGNIYYQEDRQQLLEEFEAERICFQGLMTGNPLVGSAWCSAPADTTQKKTGMRLSPQVGG